MSFDPSRQYFRFFRPRRTTTIQSDNHLGLLPTDLLLEIIESADFHTIWLLTQTCKRLRTISLAWVLRHYKATGVCDYGEGIRLTSSDELTLEENIAAITHLSIRLSIGFRCAVDFNGKWKLLETLVVALQGLSTFNCEAPGFPSSMTGWYHKRLFERLWRAILSRKEVMVISNAVPPFVLSTNQHQDPAPVPTPFRAHHAWPRRLARAILYRGKQAGSSSVIACKKSVKHLVGTDKSDTPPPEFKLKLDFIGDYCPFIGLEIIETPSKRFALFVSSLEHLRSLHISSKNVSDLDWSAILPQLDRRLTALSSLTIHQKCHGLTKEALRAFLRQHTSIAKLILTLDDPKIIAPDTFEGCLPMLTVLAGSAQAVTSVLRGADLKLHTSLRVVKITDFHDDGCVIRTHKRFDFAGLDTALDLLGSTSTRDLGIGLPGGKASMRWLTEKPSHGNHTRTLEGLGSVYVWSSDCQPFDDDIPQWLEEYRQRTFPAVEKIKLVMHRTKISSYDSHPCPSFVSSGSAFE